MREQVAMGGLDLVSTLGCPSEFHGICASGLRHRRSRIAPRPSNSRGVLAESPYAYKNNLVKQNVQVD